MRISCLSDLHGNLPIVENCDMVLLAGDLCPFGNHQVQLEWIDGDFHNWLDGLHERSIPVVAIAGNHDGIIEDIVNKVSLKWIYLQDNSVMIGNFKIWGTPWVLPYGDWAFMKSEEWLSECFSNIPEDVDIIVTHGPPYGYGDKCPEYVIKNGVYVREWKSQGSKAMLQTLDRVKPKLMVFGHIHQGRGMYRRNDTLLCNAAIWDHSTDKINSPMIVNLD